jgi:hypothetical protein
MLKKSHLSVFLVLVTISLALIMPSTLVRAQSADGNWSNFVNISNTPTASTYPCIVADAQGYVHVLWSEDVGGITNNPMLNANGVPAIDSRGNQINYLYNAGNTLFYSRWDGVEWLAPIDIQVNTAGLIEYPRAAVDHNGILHVVWGASEGQSVRVMYSQVPAISADQNQEWSKPVVLVEQSLAAYYPFDIAIDSKDSLHLLYFQLGENSGVFVINSADGGNAWSNPTQLYQTQDPAGSNEGVSPTSLVIDAKDRLHATWTLYDSTGNGKAIFYSQSSDFGDTWTQPYEVAKWHPGWYETDWLSTGVVGDEIHLSWEGGEVAYQNERLSTDGGRTWSENQVILPNLVGENGFANYVVDSSNLLHLLVVKRADPNSFAQGVWHTTWDQDHWIDPELLGTRNLLLYEKAGKLDPQSLETITQGTFTGNGLRYQMSTIVNGNQLFVVVVNEFDGEIWSSHTTLGAPYISPKPYPFPTASIDLMPSATPQITTTPTVQSIETYTPTPQTQPGETAQDSGIQTSDLVLFGVLPAAIIVIGIIAYIMIFKRS